MQTWSEGQNNDLPSYCGPPDSAFESLNVEQIEIPGTGLGWPTRYASPEGSTLKEQTQAKESAPLLDGTQVHVYRTTTAVPPVNMPSRLQAAEECCPQGTPAPAVSSMARAHGLQARTGQGPFKVGGDLCWGGHVPPRLV